MDPAFPFAHKYLWRIYEKQGRHAEEVEYFARVNCSVPDDKARAKCREVYVGAYEREGIEGFYKEIAGANRDALKRHEFQPDKEGEIHYDLARESVRLNDKEASLDHLNRALEISSKYSSLKFVFPYLGVDPAFDSLRDHPRYQEVLRRINLR